MWIMGEVIRNYYDEFNAKGYDYHGIPYDDNDSRSTSESYEDDDVNYIEESESNKIFPLINVCNGKNKIKGSVIYNITLTDEQFEVFMNTIKEKL